MTASTLAPPPAGLLPTELQNGDRLTQPEFHERYKRMPPHFRAELVGGIVTVPSPMKNRHGTNTFALGGLFQAYENATPGTEVGAGCTIILNEENEPQPDISLRILPAFGGRTTDTPEGYIAGAPEFVCEISDSTRYFDLNSKKREYAAAGVLEYLVFVLRDRQFRWFDLSADRELAADSDGILRVRSFPGLWIEPSAAVERNLFKLISFLQQGLASPEHAAFVQHLQEMQTAKGIGE
jgi:hypothetical protein